MNESGSAQASDEAVSSTTAAAKKTKTSKTTRSKASTSTAAKKTPARKSAVKTSAEASADSDSPENAPKPKRTRKTAATAADKKAGSEAASAEETAAETKSKTPAKRTATRKSSAKSKSAASAQENAPAGALDFPVSIPEEPAAVEKTMGVAKAPKKTARSKSAAKKTTVQAGQADQQEVELLEAPQETAGTETKSSRVRRGSGRKTTRKTPQPVARQDVAEPASLAEADSGETREETAAQTNFDAQGELAAQAEPNTQDAENAQNGQGTQEAQDAEDERRKGRGRSRGRGGRGRNKSARTEEGSEAQEENADEPQKRAKRKMFVSVLPGEQVEVVIAEDGMVQEYYVEMLHQVKIKGNIYKGVIHNIDPNLQAAFVSYGAAKNGFLQIDEVHPEYYLNPAETLKGHKYPLMQKVLKPGQEILVQVVKEPAGTKGAFLTTYLSLPGRFLVLTPGREQIGVSRKVDDDGERSRLKDMLSDLTPGPGLGVIVRTVSNGASKASLQQDLQFLKRLWHDVRKRGATEKAPCLLYQELGLASRSVRDYLTDDVTELWVDNAEVAEEMRGIASLLFPKRQEGLIQLHTDVDKSIFERFGLRKQLQQVQSREVVLPSGARLVFDNTEALTAIDINSGRTAGKNNFEDMAYRINLEAAKHIPLQLRLRDIGGQIVIDFIEMRDRSHWREVERAVRMGMKGDRARHDINKISDFGLMEIVRQRLGSSAISITTEPCPLCGGTGQRRNLEWQALQALRDIERLVRQSSRQEGKVVYVGPADLVLYLLNHKRERLVAMESESGLKLELKPESTPHF